MGERIVYKIKSGVRDIPPRMIPVIVHDKKKKKKCKKVKKSDEVRPYYSHEYGEMIYEVLLTEGDYNIRRIYGFSKGTLLHETKMRINKY